MSTHGRKTLNRIVPILKTAWDHSEKFHLECVVKTWVAGGPSTVNSNHNLKDIVDFSICLRGTQTSF